LVRKKEKAGRSLAENCFRKTKESPSLNNLPKVLRQPPEQMLVLNPIGEYLHGPPRTGESQQEIDPQTQLPVQPTTQHYDVTYALHGAEGPPPAPRIEVHVRECPNGSWAKYMLNEYPLGVSLTQQSPHFSGIASSQRLNSSKAPGIRCMFGRVRTVSYAFNSFPLPRMFLPTSS